MRKKVILHVPHSSTHIPFTDGYILDRKSLEDEMLKLTDWYTDDLFYSENDSMIRAEFSRIFCDVERFSDDAQEVMAQYGMGVLYEKNDDGIPMRKVDAELKEKVLKNFYWPHHDKFSKAVNEHLKLYGKALILDCHSYPNIPIKRDLNQNPDRPDFNIGTDPYHTPQWLIDLSVNFFKENGYSLGVDWPYKGSIVPLEFYQKDNRVQTIMLEINRKLYLKEPSNEKSENYEEMKNVVKDFIEVLKESLLDNL